MDLQWKKVKEVLLKQTALSWRCWISTTWMPVIQESTVVVNRSIIETINCKKSISDNAVVDLHKMTQAEALPILI